MAAKAAQMARQVQAEITREQGKEPGVGMKGGTPTNRQAAAADLYAPSQPGGGAVDIYA